MSGKRKNKDKPRKLSTFNNLAGTPEKQHGAGPSHSQHSIGMQADQCEGGGRGERAHSNLQHNSSDPANADINSPLRQKRRISDAESYVSDSHPNVNATFTNNPYNEKLNAFPTSGQPIVDTDLKEMLLSLRGALQQDMLSFMQKSKMEMDALGERVDYIEHKMNDFTEAHNDLVDSHVDLEDEIKHLKLKVSDLEDRSRRNNIKFRGIPENIKNSDLKQFLCRMMSDLIPTISPQELVIDRAHRLPKPSHIPEKLPRDVIAKIHFYHVKDYLMQLARQRSPLPDPYAGIQLYSDLSQATILARKNLNPITKILRNHNIVYKWGFPTKLLIERDSISYSIYTLEDGLKYLKSWGLLPKEGDLNLEKPPLGKIAPQWQTSHG